MWDQHTHTPLLSLHSPVMVGQGFWSLDFSELCHHCSNQISCSELSTHRVSRAQPRLCSSCWQPGRPKLLSRVSTSCPATEGLCQANGDTAPGSTSRASLPLPEAHSSSDLRASGLVSVAAGTSGLHINYLMNVALFSVHESFMTRVQFWQKCVFSVSIFSCDAEHRLPIRAVGYTEPSIRAGNSHNPTSASFNGWLRGLKPSVQW